MLEGETPGEPFRILFPSVPLPLLFTMKHMKVMKGTEEESPGTQGSAGCRYRRELKSPTNLSYARPENMRDKTVDMISFLD